MTFAHIMSKLSLQTNFSQEIDQFNPLRHIFSQPTDLQQVHKSEFYRLDISLENIFF